MVRLLRLRYLLALFAAFFLLLLSATSLAEGSIALRVFNQEIRPMENYKARSQPLICNVTDKVSGDYALTGWRLPSSVSYQLNPRSAPTSVRSSFPTIVGNSFGTWSPLTKGVTFTRGPDTSTARARFDGKNIIAWSSQSRNILGATYIWYNPDTKYIAEVDTLLNSTYSWSWTNPASVNVDQICPATNTYDTEDILTHELGHWIGLDDLYNSADEDLTMYGYGAKQELKKDTLETGDKTGVANIYH